MSTIVTRSGKGAALTHTEVDANFTNLNADKAEASAVILATQKGAASGVAPLDAASKISSTYLPSYVDDVLEYANYAALPATGETGKIYVALDTNKTYRWSGSAYVYITSGAVDSVAGKTGVVTLTSTDVGLGNVTNTSDANKPISTSTQTALDLKAPLASPTFTGTTTATNLAYTGTLTGSTGILNIGSGQVYKDASGKVGIGTSSPSSVLNVKSSAPIFRLETTGTVTSTGTAYNVIRDSTGSDVFVNGFAGLANCYQFGTVFANGFMRFLTGNQVEAMRIDASGNVGIGTTAAPTKLTVYNATDNSVPLSIQGNTSLIKDYGPSINFQYQNSQVLANIKGAWDATGSGGYGNLIFSTRGADVVTERMRIDASGNVGIGTTAAPTKLTVYNATDNSVPLSIQGNTSLIKDYGPSINFQYQNSQVLANIKGAWDATGSGGYGNLIFSTRGADVVTERMRIDSSGNVGIGTTETSNGLLTLVGDGRALFISVKTTGASTEGGEMGWARGTDGTNFWTMDVLAGAAPTIRLINNSGAGVSLTSGATAWAAYSDIRLKTNVMPLRLVLSDILDIECINYHLKDIDTNEDRIRIGVSAQSLIGKFDEVIDVTPKKKDPTEYLSVRYSDMIPYLIKAIQELKAIIDTQQEQINSLLGK
jgi:hypothetical protein